jgi:predicted NAD-dependent protein-ADP-ribosyltransferase YbiA (DUF1768 family)
MYRENIVFLFYSKSSNKPYPGYGSGEKMLEINKNDYSELSKIPEWRKKLSNFWLSNIKIDDYTFASVEHYYQACKFKKNNPDFYFQFSINSDSNISKDPKMAKSAGGKSGKYKNKLLRNKNIIIDDDFFNTNIHNEEMYKAQYAKFTQNDDLKNLLLQTKNAKLMHHTRGSGPVFFENLVNIRNSVNN